MTGLPYPLDRLIAFVRSGRPALAELREAVACARAREKSWVVIPTETLAALVAEIEVH